MGKGLPRSHSRGEPLRKDVIKRTIVLRDAAMTVDGATGAGDGQLVIGDFPEGNILILGAVSYMQFTGPTSGDLDDAWEGDYSIGTTADANDTLDTTDINIINTTALAAATAEVSPMTRAVITTTAIIVDNTDGSLEINLNLLIDDGNIGADSLAFTVSGELHILYSMFGDD